MGRGKKNHINEILNDLSGLDPGLLKSRPEIRKIVEKMIELRPDVGLSLQFRAELRSRIFKEEKKDNRIIKFFSPRRMMLAASIFSAILVIVLLPALLLNGKNKLMAENQITFNSLPKSESSIIAPEQTEADVSDESALINTYRNEPAPEPSLEAGLTFSDIKQDSSGSGYSETNPEDLSGPAEGPDASYSSLPIEKRDPSETRRAEAVEIDKLPAGNELHSGSAEQEKDNSAASGTRHYETVEDEEYKLMDSFAVSETAVSNDGRGPAEELISGSDYVKVSGDTEASGLDAVSAAVMKENGMKSDSFSDISEYLKRGEFPPEQILESSSLFGLFQDFIAAEKPGNIPDDFYSAAAVSPYDPESAWLLVYTDFPEIEKSRIEISFNRDIVYTVRTAADPDIDVQLSSDRSSLLISAEGNGRHFFAAAMKLVKAYNDIAGIKDTASAKLTVFRTDKMDRDTSEVHNIVISSSMNELMTAAVPFYMWFESLRNPESADLEDLLELKKILADYSDQSEEVIERLSGLLDLTIDIYQKAE